MSLLEKIIWLADYIEPNRTTPGVEKVRRLAETDLDEALRRALKNSLRHLEEKGLAPHPATGEALAFLNGSR
jgi:HD superfamily phosphohydrolase YqeK